MLDYAIATLELFGNIEWLAQDRSLGMGQSGYGHSSLIMVFLLRPKGTRSKLGRHVCEPHRLQDHSFIVVVKLCAGAPDYTFGFCLGAPLNGTHHEGRGVAPCLARPKQPPPPLLSPNGLTSLYLTTTLLPPPPGSAKANVCSQPILKCVIDFTLLKILPARGASHCCICINV